MKLGDFILTTLAVAIGGLIALAIAGLVAKSEFASTLQSNSTLSTILNLFAPKTSTS